MASTCILIAVSSDGSTSFSSGYSSGGNGRHSQPAKPPSSSQSANGCHEEASRESSAFPVGLASAGGASDGIVWARDAVTKINTISAAAKLHSMKCLGGPKDT